MSPIKRRTPASARKTDENSSDNEEPEEGELSDRNHKSSKKKEVKVKVRVFTEKKIRKADKFKAYEKQQTQRLLAAPTEPVEETKNEKWSGIMAQIFDSEQAAAQREAFCDEDAEMVDFSKMTVEEIKTHLGA